MARCKIIWSHKARIRLYQILEFYTNRNKSKVYSAKLYSRFIKELKLISKHPDLGMRTSFDEIRGLIVLDYIIYYEFLNDELIVHTLWPTHQNPELLRLK